MRQVFYFCFILVFLASEVYADSISLQMSNLEHGTEQEISIKISADKTISAVLDKTTKGNGTLLLGDYSLLRIYDTHGDGYYYEDKVLNIELADITGNGLNELIITGVVINTDEKEVIQGYKECVYIFSFIDGKYKQIYKRSPIEIDLAK